MKTKLVQLLMMAVLFSFAYVAQAAITCTISSGGFSSAYVPSTAAQNVTQSSFTTTCQRGAVADATTISYGVQNNNGSHAAANQNRAQIGATTNRINYDLFADSGCSVVWRNNAANDIVDTIPVLTGFLPSSKTTNYWGCIPGSQVVPAGTYTDVVTITARLGLAGTGAVLATNTFPVTIVTPSSCSVTTAPGAVAFGTYAAFGIVHNANTTFATTCTSLLPYSIDLGGGATGGGVVNGLNYTLAINTINTGGTNPFSSTGTGVAQTFFINGVMAAGQAGTCATGSCPGGTQARTLTITY